ncbi:MAG: hypothetical protein J0H15_01215 [Xanthomonadales bacterium]|nr:hypothetical protein [Xanthomonadales bacterium]
MSDAYRRLAAGLPQRRAPGTDAFPSDPRAVRGWLDTLPLANTGAAARRLLDAVKALNGQVLAPQRRLELLELLRPALLQLSGALDRQLVGAGFPLPAQQADLGELAAALQVGFAAGYRSALVELTAPRGSVPLLRARTVALAALRALQHDGERLARACLLYRAPPRGAWQDLHDVHAFAAQLGLDGRRVGEGMRGTELDPRSAYVQALLFALANPYAFSQREQMLVAAIAGALVPHARLLGRAAGSIEDGVRVPIDADRGPGYVGTERDGGAGEAVMLELQALLEAVGERLRRAEGARVIVMHPPGGAPFEAEVELLQRVVANLAARHERGHARIGGDHALNTVLGLHDLHAVLAGGEDFASFEQRLGGLAAEPSGAPWRMPGARGGALRSARVLDQALGGYRLLWQRGAGGENVRARVGELVGLSLPASGEAAADWMPGVIRWLRIDDTGDVECGIQLLARRALPALLHQPGDTSRAALRGILLADLEAAPASDYASLLVSTELDRDAAAVEITAPADTTGAPRPARRIVVERPTWVSAGGAYGMLRLPEASAADPAVA